MEHVIPELLLIKACLNRETFNKYSLYVSSLLKNKQYILIYKVLVDIYDKYELENITLEELALHLKTFNIDSSLIPALEEVEYSEEHMQDILREIKNRSLANDLAVIAIDVNEGRKSVEDIYKKIDEFEKGSIINLSEQFVDTDLEKLYEESVHTQGLRWRLGTLNRMLGSLRKGDFGFVFARPETGKTTFLASEVTRFAEQTDAPILWFNNEEQGNKVAIRCHQAALNMSLTELFSNVKENKDKFTESTRGNIKIFDSASIHRRQVEQLCRELKPALVVFDQIDKIKGFADDREDLRLGNIYIWARELAKEYCPVIGVCQAAGTGEGKTRLTMDDVANAKTAKQAEADWILGIGKDNSDGMEFVRFLNISKNKLTGDEDTNPDLRHGYQQVIIDPMRARYVDV